jgi:hypothetical protein
MKYVLDSSVAFKWVVPESDTPRAVQLRDEFRTAIDEPIAPDVLPPELAHALTRAERQGLINDAVTRLIDVSNPDPIATVAPAGCRHFLDVAHWSLRLPLRRARRASGVRAGQIDALADRVRPWG